MMTSALSAAAVSVRSDAGGCWNPRSAATARIALTMESSFRVGLFLSFGNGHFLDDDVLLGPVFVVGPAARGRAETADHPPALLARRMVALHPLDLLHHFLARDHLAEYRVVPVELRLAGEADEELGRRAVGIIGPGHRHRAEDVLHRRELRVQR